LIFRLSNNINTMSPTNPNKPSQTYFLLLSVTLCPPREGLILNVKY
jgi:hypothetical protein